MAKAKKKAAPKRGGKKAAKRKPAVKRHTLTKPDQTLPAAPEVKSPRWDAFIDDYCTHWIAARAAKTAGYSPNCAKQIGFELLRIPYIAQAVATRKAEIEEKRQAEADVRTSDTNLVLRRLRLMVEADPRELSRIELRCCRYCWGKDNRYQYTHAELQLSRGEYGKLLLKDRPELEDEPLMLAELLEEFDTKGGGGFDPNLDPNPKCEECGGRGVEEVVFGDIRELSEGASLLYQGVKRTKEGLEVKTHSQLEALRMLGQHHGMFAQRVKVGGDPENPTPIAAGFAYVPPKRDPDSYGDEKETQALPLD